jgi:hypothetical protein
MTNAEAELPGVFTQLKAINNTGTVAYNARSGSLWSSWAFSSMVRRFTGMEKKLTNSDPFRKSTDKHSIYPHHFP